MSGEGATGGAINYVTKQPTHRADQERGVHFLSIHSAAFAPAYGSGGSTNVQGLDYRFDVSRRRTMRLYRRHLHQNLQCFRPTQLSRLRQFQDLGRDRIQAGQGPASIGARRWCRPMRPACPTNGIVSGCGLNTISNRSTARGSLNPVTIDARTLQDQLQRARQP